MIRVDVALVGELLQYSCNTNIRPLAGISSISRDQWRENELGNTHNVIVFSLWSCIRGRVDPHTRLDAASRVVEEVDAICRLSRNRNDGCNDSELTDLNSIYAELRVAVSLCRLDTLLDGEGSEGLSSRALRKRK